MMRFLLAALFVCTFAQQLDAQVQTTDPLLRPRIGLFGNYAIGLHTASFSSLPTIPNCCPEFSGVTGTGWFAGLTYISPFNSTAQIAIRLHYGQYQAPFSTTENKTIMMSDGTTGPATIRHDLTASFKQISIEPLFGYHLNPEFTLHGGFTAGYLLGTTFDQAEVLVSPSNATFSNDQRQRNVVSGDIPKANQLALGITVGASYDIALNADRTVFLSPEVLFTFSPMPVVSGLSWNTHQIRAGLALSFIPPDVSDDSLSDSELYDFARTITPPTKNTPGIPFTSSVSASGLTEDGRTTGTSSIRIEEFASRRVRPILPYVFFDENSSDVPVRYRRLRDEQTEAFAVENFYNLDAMHTYYHVLNVIGKRMQQDPSASITLTGCTDGTEASRNAGIAASRAAAVKSYLVGTWDVDPSRVNVETRGLPDKPSNEAEVDGRAENRRVEIGSSSPAILAPVESRDTMRVFQPAGIRFQPSIDPRIPIATWTLFVTNNDRIIKTFHDGNPIPPSVDWRIEEQSAYIPHGTSELKYLLVVRDSSGMVIPSPSSKLPISEVTIDSKRSSGGTDKTIDRYSLILFAFDKADLTPANQTVVDDVKGRIQPTSLVRVVGYTDRTGSEDYNQRLSEQRARTVAKALGVGETNASGLGERLPLYNNDTPEGRFYSRTVEVLVETPQR